MIETTLVAGCIKAILEKYSEPIVKGIFNRCKTEWEKFKVDFDISFIHYLKNSVEKYGKIKTILYRTEPKFIYDFFVCPNLTKDRHTIIDGNSVDNILSISNFIIIQGNGGIGKSTFLKHLFIDEISKKELIPVFIELKDLNSINENYDINNFIFQRLYDLGSTLKEEYMEYALRSGCFLFLLDGYDEIFTDKKDIFFRKFNSFCDRYSKNHFIISSRPFTEFVEFQRFSVLSLGNLSKDQALEMIHKVEFDPEIKQRFLIALDNHLYNNHTSFASNPLLLNIMLLTFDNFAEIPEKLHLFYANAFETLYSKHDATKAGYRRELKCSLSYDSFKKVFSYFCFLTYYQGKSALTYDEINAVLKKISPNVPPFEPEDFIFDLANSICVIYKDGLNYKFTHRSFQEFFTAVFLKELSDQNMKKLGIGLAKKDFFRLAHDSVFPMLRDMAEQRFEQNILLPLIIEVEDTCSNSNKYDFYFNALSPGISFFHPSQEENVELVVSITNYTNHDMLHFLFYMSRYYIDITPKLNRDLDIANKNLLNFLEKTMNYKIDNMIYCNKYIDNKEFCSLIRKTWIGMRIEVMSTLRVLLNKKHKDEEIDLNSLLIE